MRSHLVGILLVWASPSCNGLVIPGLWVPHDNMPGRLRKMPLISPTLPSFKRSSTCLLCDNSDNDRLGDVCNPEASKGYMSRPELATSDELYVETFKSRSTTDLLKELDNRNVRYPPTATRAYLLKLLQQSIDNSNSETDSESEPLNDKSLSEKVAPIKKASSVMADRSEMRSESVFVNQTSPLRKLLDELDHRNVRYSPTASKEELEVLLRESVESYQNLSLEVPAFRPASDGSRRKRRANAKPLRVLLAELESQNIRYDPLQSRNELEELLRRQGSRQATTSTPREIASRRNGRQRRRQLHAQTRVKSRSTDKSFLYKATELTSRSASKLPRRVARMVQETELTSRLSNAAKRAVRQARRVKRRASDFWNDEDGIREPKWEFVSKDAPIDVPATPVHDDTDHIRVPPPPARRHLNDPPLRWGRADPSNRAPGRRRQSQSHPRDDRDQTIPRRHREVRPTSGPNARRSPPASQSPPPSANRPQLGKPQPRRNPLQLPPTPEEAIVFPHTGHRKTERKQQRPSRAGRPRKQRSQRDSSKRIYAQYNRLDMPDIKDIDAFDRFGNFVADSAEQMMWGPGDESESTRPPESEQHVSESQRRRPLHWKDRLAEQVDYALGIHEDGNYCNSWSSNVDEFKKKERGAIRSNTTEMAARRKTSSRKPSTAFWEDEGSVLTLLFGRTEGGGPLSIDRYLDNTNTTKHLTFFLRSLIKGALLVASYTCRWASVRGAVPQPVVVLVSVSSFLSARPRRRVWTLALALLATRTVGELVHGYIHGDEDWEDDDGREQNQSL